MFRRLLAPRRRPGDDAFVNVVPNDDDDDHCDASVETTKASNICVYNKNDEEEDVSDVWSEWLPEKRRPSCGD